jgi:hypothetical protein
MFEGNVTPTSGKWQKLGAFETHIELQLAMEIYVKYIYMLHRTNLSACRVE